MENQQFDELTRRMGAAVSRRQALKVVLTATIGSIFFRSKRAEASSITNTCGTFCNQLPPGPQRGNCLFQAIHRQGPCYDCGPRGSNKGLCGGTCCDAPKTQCLKGTCCALEGVSCAQNNDCCFGVCASASTLVGGVRQICCGTGTVCDPGAPGALLCCVGGESCCTGTNSLGEPIATCCAHGKGCNSGVCCLPLNHTCQTGKDCCPYSIFAGSSQPDCTRQCPSCKNECCLVEGSVCLKDSDCCNTTCKMVPDFGYGNCCQSPGTSCTLTITEGQPDPCCHFCDQASRLCCAEINEDCNPIIPCCVFEGHNTICGPNNKCCEPLGKTCLNPDDCCEGICYGESGNKSCCIQAGDSCRAHPDNCCIGFCDDTGFCACHKCEALQGGQCVPCKDANMCCNKGTCVATCPDGQTCQNGQCPVSTFRTCPQGVPGSNGPHFHDCDDSGSDGPCLCMTTNDGKNVCVANGGCGNCFSDCSKCASGTVCVPDVNCQNPNICGGGLSVFCGTPC